MSRLPTSYFDEMYAAADDPWEVKNRWYEQRKRDMLVAALPDQQYAFAFEPGCSIGALTQQLAARSNRLLACDASKRAVATASRRLADKPWVDVRHAVVPEDWPCDRTFDLVVLSELLYYLDEHALSELLDRAVVSLSERGTLVVAHWRPAVADHLLTGDAVHEAVLERSELCLVSRTVEEDFRLDVLLRAPTGTPGLSVAARTGVPGAGSGHRSADGPT